MDKPTHRYWQHLQTVIIGVVIVCVLGSFNYALPQHHGNSVDVHWSVRPNSYITINGSSNVNTFGCEATGLYKAEALQGTIMQDGKSIKMTGSITLAINQFDCKNRMLTNDLRKTLKADEFPHMNIRFLSLERMPIYSGGEDFISGQVIIELAGKRKPFYLRYSFSKTGSGYRLEGSRAFSFADFELSPPKKVGGLVKVNDDFDVAFTLMLSDVD